MCGIAGIAALNGDLDEADARARLTPMLDALYHRGPDDSGVHLARGAVLGVRRLAIRAVASGSQPLVDAATGVVVVCNGEIDNHRELRAWLHRRGRTVDQETDVAVLPGLYLELGAEFVSRLVGTFVLAVWDPRQRMLLLARDRAGERSVFFTRRGSMVVFGSELSALAADRGLVLEPDPEAVRHYLQFGSFSSPASPMRDVQRVGPAEIVVLTESGATRRRYWRWAAALPEVPPVNRAATPDLLDPLFREAVRRQSDVDVDYGVFLSGGVDSSLVLAVAQQVRPRPNMPAYTLRFGEQSFDEGEYALAVAARYQARSVVVRVGAADLPTELSTLVRLVGEPLADPAWVPTAMLARRAAQDVKMVLVGEGADELFGGYPTYPGAQLAERYGHLPAPLRAAIRRVIRALPISDRKVAISYLLKRFVDGEGLDGYRRHLVWTSSIPPATLQRLGVEPVWPASDALPDERLLDRIQAHDLETSLAEGLLTKADRASMTSSLELRAPFLDLAVMEFAATLDGSARVRGLTTKVFLKRYAERYLPRRVVYRRKRGLSVPLGPWLRGPLQDWARERLASPRLASAGVDPAAAMALLDEHRSRRADQARPLWTLLVLSEWLEWFTGTR
jgi:asparagine synthase (glutamine-hydrolysing)